MILATLLLIAFALLVLFGYAKAYHSLATMHVQSRSAWGQIESLLDRRHELIPDLVDRVRHHIDGEHETVRSVVEARSAALGASSVAERASAEKEVSAKLCGLYSLAEQHPHLGTDEAVHGIRKEILKAEEKVAFATQYYNDVASAYNARLRRLPTAIVGKLGSLRPHELFVVE
ncbi:MAG TPA: LemA family protein [Fimbriimonadaceae bacterium]|nr:LemA family protein [Fimbriimonadaceae bacterium]